MGPIAKSASAVDKLKRPFVFFKNGRSAFEALLRKVQIRPDEKVLLPAYIGWSPREGSGVFDPVKNLAVQYQFYRMDRNLRIDLDDYCRIISRERIRLVVFIHYFGYVDPSFESAVEMARRRGIVVLEDAAHALLTDVVHGRCGRLGDASLFSLHKLLPFPDGGALALRSDSNILGGVSSNVGESRYPIWDYDLVEIAARRNQNAQLVCRLINESLQQDVTPLWGPPGGGEVAQTYPVLIGRVSRRKLYDAMNERGFGVVALYHTLIQEIPREVFPDSFEIAERILNLPVHQDADAESLVRMISELKKCIDLLRWEA